MIFYIFLHGIFYCPLQHWHKLVQIHVYRSYLAANASPNINFTTRCEIFMELWWTRLPCPDILHRFCMEYLIVRFNIGINWFKNMFIVYTSLRKHRLISILLREAKYSWSYDKLISSEFLTKSQSWRYKHNSYNEIFII